MNKEMNCCPVCNARLSPIGGFLLCPKHCKWAGTKELWQALIQSQKDLGIARQALCEIRFCDSCGFDVPAQTPWEIIAEKALEQIEHKE